MWISKYFLPVLLLSNASDPVKGQNKPGPPAQQAEQAQPAPLRNVALKAHFHTSSIGDDNWNGLVDGVKNSDTPPGCYRWR